ncbi:MAG: class I SAM-dependent methyltransferase [Acidimicrobiia bacterium]|nr:class I SAM-dependent methyltransferase [Acidimicrobiia bacterium]
MTEHEDRPGSGAAARRWTAELAAWEIPAAILDQAPESPWGYPPELFRAPDRPGAAPEADAGAVEPALATRRALDALPAGGSVLDVGCGGGVAAFALAPPAGLVVGVDAQRSMLDLFAATAAERHIAYRTIEGRWPDVASGADPADVVVCHNVFYNVADLVPFAVALDAHARHRVVVEITRAHPMVRFGPFWRHFWDLERPDGPTAELALAVLTEAGLAATLETAPGTARRTDVDREVVVAMTRRRLCLGPDRDAEIARLLADEPFAPTERAVLWWEPRGR